MSVETIPHDAMKLSVAPDQAWEPLPAGEWNDESIRHLLRRAGWTARPADVTRARQAGLAATLDQLFPLQPPLLAKPPRLTKFEEGLPELQRQQRETKDPEERRMRQRELRERSRQAVQDLSIKWLQFAAGPGAASFAKWSLFLGDVYVVSYEKVQNAALIYEHETILQRHGLGPAPALTKAVSRSPAMIQYLDLNQSKKGAPNENFARELFELFTLGEGNYTEKDIKEAARAFTGYRQRLGNVDLVPRQHDSGRKTIFGQSGNYSGDDVIDLVYRQPAAGMFLPREMTRFYLTTEPLPPAYFEPLRAWWGGTGYDLRRLVHRFFGSRLFFDPSLRGNYIKSPLQFYLGLVQDLGLDVAPLPRQVLGSLRQMGQVPFYPPNVRGWVGGRQWINSATLAARRQLVQALFTPVNEANLNADEMVEIAAARAAGQDRFTVTDERLREFSALDDEQVTARFVDYFLPASVTDDFRETVRSFVATEGAPNRRDQRVRNTAVTLLQSPEYQLC
ncbi:MAG TPA: DUF1800 domain-containing protein [Opitutaceae bacterium]